MASSPPCGLIGGQGEAHGRGPGCVLNLESGLRHLQVLAMPPMVSGQSVSQSEGPWHS